MCTGRRASGGAGGRASGRGGAGLRGTRRKKYGHRGGSLELGSQKATNAAPPREPLARKRTEI